MNIEVEEKTDIDLLKTNLRYSCQSTFISFLFFFLYSDLNKISCIVVLFIGYMKRSKSVNYSPRKIIKIEPLTS